ncbi:hypothetical protein J6590_039574 [Homalodisca vitripennis]|nr:hypothetical protein J6590_039574 [Homalodisca vitripennis]
MASCAGHGGSPCGEVNGLHVSECLTCLLYLVRHHPRFLQCGIAQIVSITYPPPHMLEVPCMGSMQDVTPAPLLIMLPRTPQLHRTLQWT